MLVSNTKEHTLQLNFKWYSNKEKKNKTKQLFEKKIIFFIKKYNKKKRNTIFYRICLFTESSYAFSSIVGMECSKWKCLLILLVSTFISHIYKIFVIYFLNSEYFRLVGGLFYIFGGKYNAYNYYIFWANWTGSHSTESRGLELLSIGWWLL